jgi:hypothetical protein
MGLSKLRDGAGDETLLFLHIVKTAGVTMTSILRRQYPNERIYRVYDDPWIVAVNRFAEMPEDERAHYRAIMGHMHLGMHKLVPGPSTYVTLLREPVDRVISAYYFVRERSSHPEHEKILRSGLDFAGVLESGFLPILANSMTQVLCTTDIPNIPYGGCTPEMLEGAKRNLERRFAVVGLTERFDETLMLLKERFGWSNLFYVRRNLTRSRPQREELSADVLDLIREYNQLDIELYAFAKARFEEQLAGLGARFERKVRAFRRANAAVSHYRRIRGRLHA